MSDALANLLPAAAIAFRGYNQRNLGRTPELLTVPAYCETVRRRLEQASQICGSVTGRPTDLESLVRDRVEPGVDQYAEAISLIIAAELAQVDLLREVHGVEVTGAKMSYGYSLGELIAVTVAGLFPLESVMRIPLELAADCAAMATDTRMAVVFSRKESVCATTISRHCEEVTAEGQGAIALSAVLSPNTLLAIGQGQTIERLRDRCENGRRLLVRENQGAWPPLHTPLVRERHIPDRASLMIRETPRLVEQPAVPVWSLVTGRREYEADSGRETLRRWVDSPQLLWPVVEQTLANDVRTVLHVGPAPNVIPATFHRLAENVVRQTLSWTAAGVGMRTVQQMVGSPWLAPLLPRSSVLLRAPSVDHVVVEDWLLANAPGGGGAQRDATESVSSSPEPVGASASGSR